MTDIVQRALNLQVGAEDVASEVFSAVAGELDALQAKAEDVFASIGMLGVDAASQLADAANAFPAYWDDQLQAVSEFAGGAFAALEAAAAGAVAGVAEAAAPIAAAWEGAAGKMAAALDEAAGSVTGSADKIKGALDGVDTSLAGITGSADGAKSGLASALDEAAGSVNGSSDKIQAAIDGITKSVGGAGDSFSSMSADAKAGLGGAVTTITADGAKIVTTFDDIAASYDRIATAADRAGLGGALLGKGVNTSSLGGAGGAAFVGAAAGEGKKAAAAGAETSGLLDRWLPSVAAIRERGALIGQEIKSIEEKISGVGNKMLMGGLVASMFPFGAEASANFIEGLVTTSKQTGLSIGKSNLLQTALVAAGVKNPSQAIAMIARMENRLHQGTTEVAGMSGQTVTGALNEPGNPKGGINPGSLNIGVPNVQIERVLAPYGLNATQLFHMSALDQITAISQAINAHQGQGPVWSNRATALIQMLFGGRGGGGGAGSASMQLVMRDWAGALSAAQSTPNFVQSLGLPANPVEAAMKTRALGYSVETGMLTVLTRLLPAISAFTDALNKAVGGGHRVSQYIFGSGNGDHYKAPGFPFGNPHATNVWHEPTAKVVKDALDWQMQHIGAPIAKFFGGLFGSSSASAATSHSSWDAMWQHYVAPHANQHSFTTAETVQAETTAARLFGINPQAMVADSYAEATLNPNAYNRSGATGPFQFMPKTWAQDTQRFLGQSLPLSYARNPYVASFIAAASMRAGGIGTEKNPEQALAHMIHSFENPGAAGEAGDMSRGLPFLKALEQALAKAEQSAKTHAPKLKTPIDASLLGIVQSAAKYGKDFSTQTEKTLIDAEHYLHTHRGPFTTAGRGLMEGLYDGMLREEPQLTGEAKKIASTIELTIRDALKTHSPSEVMAELGADAMAGLALGMRRATPGVSDAAQSAAAQVTGAIGAPALAGAARGQQTIIIELDGRTLVQYVLRETHQQTKLVAKFN